MGDNHPNVTPLRQYRDKMGHGLVNAAALLAKIDGTDAPVMSFPNVTLMAGTDRQISPVIYFENGNALTYTVEVADQNVASAKVEDGKIVITGKAAGQTEAVIRGGNQEQRFVISVRKDNNGNSWL